MGMFDYVNFECDCPKCGERVTGFQSKDRDCELGRLEISEVDNFYTKCEGCHTWVEFQRRRFVQPFEMFIDGDIQDEEVTEKALKSD